MLTNDCIANIIIIFYSKSYSIKVKLIECLKTKITIQYYIQVERLDRSFLNYNDRNLFRTRITKEQSERIPVI